MIDAHIHIERGPYTKEWIDHFVRQALYMNLDEIWILEHCYRFREFVPMYDGVCNYSRYIDHWFRETAGVLELSDYLRLIDEIRNSNPAMKINFGLEVCYFHQFEEFVYQHTKNLELDFIVGSVHFVDNFAFDHKREHWNTVDVDTIFRRYFDVSIELAKSGIFDGIAHPDSIKLFGHRPSFSQEKA